MLLALPLFAGLVAGKLTGGTFRGLASAPLRAGWLLVLGFAIQLILYNPWTESQMWDIRHGHIAYVISLLLILGGLIRNLGRLRWPLVVLIAGASLNAVVIFANGGAMPVVPNLLAQTHGRHMVWQIAHQALASNVTPMTAITRLGPLGDRIEILNSVYSIGDVLIGLGGFLLVALEMHRVGAAMKGRVPRLQPAGHEREAGNQKTETKERNLGTSPAA